MEIKIIVENTAYKKYIAQHGLSILVKSDNKKILFDAGQNPYILKKNMELLNENSNFDGIIISHGHYDHTDGLKDIINNTEDINIPIYVHPDAFLERYSNNGTYIGIDKDIKKFLKNYDYLNLIEKPYHDKNNNLIISGKIERNNYFEPELFYKLKENEKLETGSSQKNDKIKNISKNPNYEIDSTYDDMFIIVDGVIITGCSHSGIINVVEYAKKINKNKIRGVIGGFHLITSSKNHIQTVYEYFENSDLEFIMPMHCTGFKALKKLSKLDNFIYGHTGKTLEL
ncbi:MBL fold metallo-hydrolase [Methanococcus aeolicus]|uniref:Beta-lactamase domain protein n=1 Tax=Methanococcus aeolicus (strain ATCC BAA-1280 / DSM 17508 / OCM 812 / Nankai-3) TaxID=419665 RepID=A6UUC9_META3|nr:MBL fold metallo-hydrolase [Methanococcus aeolicus]ABR56101.1 beta-lactamase domain protein [Methanococcus aeolicus Nankai-3]UXM85289.1 MBL fold metallo-hydrolase [Methanococcus aeolicus]